MTYLTSCVQSAVQNGDNATTFKTFEKLCEVYETNNFFRCLTDRPKAKQTIQNVRLWHKRKVADVRAILIASSMTVYCSPCNISISQCFGSLISCALF